MVLKSCRPVGFIFFILNLDSCQFFLALNRADQTYGQRGVEGRRNCLSVTKNMFYSLISLKIKVIIRFPFDPVNITFKVGISLLSIYFFVLTRFFCEGLIVKTVGTYVYEKMHLVHLLQNDESI